MHRNFPRREGDCTCSPVGFFPSRLVGFIVGLCLLSEGALRLYYHELSYTPISPIKHGVFHLLYKHPVFVNTVFSSDCKILKVGMVLVFAHFLSGTRHTGTPREFWLYCRNRLSQVWPMGDKAG